MGFSDMKSGWVAGGSGWAMYAGMIAFWAAVVVLVVWGVKALAVSAEPQTAPLPPRENLADVLKRRYAAGDIDSAEFEQQRRDLF